MEIEVKPMYCAYCKYFFRAVRDADWHYCINLKRKMVSSSEPPEDCPLKKNTLEDKLTVCANREASAGLLTAEDCSELLSIISKGRVNDGI